MITATVKPMTWLAAMRAVVDGGKISGADVVRLHAMPAGEQPIYRRAVYDARRLAELTIGAMVMARRIDEGDWWLMQMLDFRGELKAATREGRPVSASWRAFAWHMGLTADFAVGLERAGLAWWEEGTNARGRAERAAAVGSKP